MMKQLLLNIGFVLFAIGTFAQNGQYEEVKHIKKSFVASPSVTLEVINKYGKVHVNTWDKDSIRIEVTIHIEAKKNDDITKALDAIDIKMEGNRDFIIAETLWGENTNIFRMGALGLKRNVSGNLDVEIDYTVYMPAATNFELENKFGDVYIPKLMGRTKLDVSYGDLRAREFSGNTNITFRHGKANIKVLHNATLNVEFGEITIGEAKDIDFTGRSAEVFITTIDNLNLDSKHDKISIKKLGFVRGKATFSDVKIERLKTGISLTTLYGDFEAQEIATTFTGINLSSNYTDISLVFALGAGFTVEGQLDNSKDFAYPESKGKLTLKDSEEDKNMQLVSGSLGGGGKLVKINAKGCYVKLGYEH